MILRSIQLEGWRCFAAQTNVGPFVDGLNIIHGPNGSGKSSLMMALARGLFDSHNVGGSDIQTALSWGRSLTPKVTIEFEKDGEGFQLFKQFIREPIAKLSRKEDGVYVPFSESRAADDKAREILSGEASRSGATKQKHWGLAQVLWATQGSLQIDELASGTRATIQDALGAQITGAGTEALEKRIADVHGQFFTPTGRLKSGASAPAVVGLEAQLTNEQSDRAEYQQRLREFDEASNRIKDLRLQTKTARDKENELSSKLKTTREQVSAYQNLTGQQKLLQTKVTASNTAYGILVEKIDAIVSAVKDSQAATIESEKLAKELPAIEKLVKQLQEAAKLADEKVQTIRGKQGEATTARQLAQLAERYVHHQENFHELEKQLSQIDEAQKSIEKLRQLRKAIIAPDKNVFKQITTAARQRDDARLKIESAVVTVTIEFDSDQDIEVTQAEDSGSRTAGKNDSVEIKGAPDVAFQLPGVGRFSATGPTTDFEALREQWEDAKRSLESLTSDYGTSDLASLDKLHAQAAELDTEVSNAEVKLTTLLDGESIDELHADRSAVLASLEEIRGGQALWKTSPPVPAELSRKADEIEKKFATEIEAADKADDEAQEKLLQETRKLDSHQAKISSLMNQTATNEKNLVSLRKDGLADDLRIENRTKLALELDVTKGKLEKVEKQIEEFGEDPTESLAKFESQQEAFRTEADDAEKGLNTETGRLQQIISEAPYSKLVEVEEEIARLERDIARDRLHIDAIGLLHKAVQQEKSGVMQSLIDPIRTRANTILKRVAGKRFDGVQFDDSLLPTGISPQSSGEAVSLTQISGGEQEQVHFAVRMALADVAFPDSRQLVVLDDVFTYTDATRLDRITNILEESADRFQIVLLTCHPERYRSAADTKFFDLEALK